MLFSGIWAVIKPWIDEKTRSKITIIGSGYKEKLLEIVRERKRKKRDFKFKKPKKRSDLAFKANNLITFLGVSKAAKLQ